MRWLDTPSLDQLAQTWRDVNLGSCDDATIGTDGCLITCFSMISGVIPPVMNKAMQAQGGFYGGCLASSFDVQRWGFEAAPELHSVTKAYQKIPFPEHERQAVWAHVRAGNPVIACIDMRPETPRFDQHWVLMVEAIGTAGYTDFVIHDPWRGTECAFTARYGSLARALVRCVLYRTTAQRDVSDGGSFGARQESRAVLPVERR